MPDSHFADHTRLTNVGVIKKPWPADSRPGLKHEYAALLLLVKISSGFSDRYPDKEWLNGYSIWLHPAQ